MMRFLLDTHVLLWAAEGSPRLSPKARDLIDDPANEILFSVASLWEVAIKTARGRDDFMVDPVELRSELLANGFTELPVQGPHVVFTSRLPAIHKDPFDRLLVAQALTEGLTLLTSDRVVASYSAGILEV